MKINKSPTVCNSITASSFEIRTANLAQSLTLGTLTNSWSFIFGDSNWKFCKVGYPVGPPKPDSQMRTFLTWDFFFYAFIFLRKKWTRDRWPKINKSPTVSNGIGASSFEIWTANLAQSLTVGTLTNSRSFIFGDSNWKFCSWLPRRPPKTRHSDAVTFDLGFFFLCFYFSVKKIKTCWIYKNTVFTNWEKYEVSWNFCLVFIIDF